MPISQLCGNSRIFARNSRIFSFDNDHSPLFAGCCAARSEAGGDAGHPLRQLANIRTGFPSVRLFFSQDAQLAAKQEEVGDALRRAEGNTSTLQMSSKENELLIQKLADATFGKEKVGGGFVGCAGYVGCMGEAGG